MPKRRLESLKATAYHEAGHAVMAHLRDVPIKCVTIVPEENTHGHIEYRRSPKWFHPDIDSDSTRARRRIEAHIQISFAGGIAERKFKGRRAPNWTVGPDNSDAVDLAFRVCSSTKAAEHYLAWLYQQAMDALEVPIYWNMVEEVATRLLDKKRLNAQQVKAAIRAAIDREIEK
jgi:hypothetical protein